MLYDPDPPEEDDVPGLTEPDYDEHPDSGWECIRTSVTNLNPDEIPF